MPAFDWNADDVVIPRVDALAVYTNECGDIVIRQEQGLTGDDAVIVIPRQFADAVLNAIHREIERDLPPVSSNCGSR